MALRLKSVNNEKFSRQVQARLRDETWGECKKTFQAKLVELEVNTGKTDERLSVLTQSWEKNSISLLRDVDIKKIISENTHKLEEIITHRLDLKFDNEKREVKVLTCINMWWEMEKELGHATLAIHDL
eukprot:6482185-Amphidinium_carterae.4